MKTKLSNLSSQRRCSFIMLKGLLLMIVLQLSNAVTALADTWNVGQYFHILHLPTPAEPYIDFEFVSDDFDGINDILAKSEFYIGWNGAEYKILSYGRCVNNEQKYNTQYGTTEQLNGTEWKERYYRKRRFYPSSLLGSGPGSVMNKSFYIRMKGRWDIDDNESNGDYDIDEKRDVNCSAYTALMKTPDVTFKRTSKTNVQATTSNLVVESGWPKTAILFTDNKNTQSDDIYHLNNLGNGKNTNGKMTHNMTIAKKENESIVLYYHRYYERTVNVAGINVRQLRDGELKTWTHNGFQNPSDLKASYNKYTEKTSLQWTNNNSNNRDNQGKNYVFKSTNGGSWEKIATLACNINKYEDSAPVGFNYDYAVMFVPDTYTAPTEPDFNSALTTKLSSAVGEKKNFEITFNAETTNDGGISLNWEPETDAYNLTYTLQRFNKDSGVWDVLYEGESTSFTDRNNLMAFHTYQYRVKLKFWNTDWIAEKSITLQQMTKVTEVNATRGTYANTVKVTWKVNQIGSSETRYVVSRRPLNDPTASYVDVYEVNGTSSTYIFEDNNALPGQYYMYRVTPYVEIPEEERAKNPSLGEWGIGSSIDADGFSVARGIVTGRVTYGTGTAVPGVKVCLEKVIDDDNNQEQYYSLSTSAKGGSLLWTPSDKVKSNNLNNNPYTVQMWVMAASKSSLNPNNCILSVKDQMSLYLSKIEGNDTTFAVKVKLPGTEETTETGLKVPIEKYSNLSFASDGNNNYVISVVGEEGVDSVSIAGTNIDWNAGEASLMVGGNTMEGENFDGYVDDVRVWTRVLNRNEINHYHKRILSGSEQGLLCYWPLDEGINNMPYAYDVSKKNGIANGNHAAVMSGARSVTMVPTSEQLALYGETNSEGSYEIRGIPFSGEGTSYIVRPILGVHEFNAKYMTRFISNSSLTHNSVDFTDVSSFRVEGNVFYENTTIPVHEAYVYIDGLVASKDGEPIMTDEEGHYSVDVPIGDHFIQIKKNGHVFTNNGRFPEDSKGVGTRFTFEQPMSNLTFWDETKVMVAGRVAGGSVEESKPLGLQQGKANIGKARIELTFPKYEMRFINVKRDTIGASVNYDINPERRDFATDTQGGKAYVEGGKRVITIETDSLTGEFAAYLPPLNYTMSNVFIPSQKNIAFDNRPMLDATTPEIVMTDSVETETGYRYFDYVAGAKVIYRSEPHLSVTENEDGSFGMDSISVETGENQYEKYALYSKAEDGSVNYELDYPVYRMLDRYIYKLYAYEPYINMDNAQKPDTTEVPLSNISVTIKNPMASTTSVMQNDGSVYQIVDETFELDDKGRASYVFYAGLPNIQSPYTRELTINYEVNDKVYPWSGNGFEAIILGALTKGNNFVTEGPDRVDMVLRDPPGSLSSTTYSQGLTVTKTTKHEKSYATDKSSKYTILTGVSMQTGGGMGAIVLNEQKVEKTTDLGTKKVKEVENSETTKETITLTRDISTSDLKDYVGAAGDVFIGTSTNLIFGECNAVVIKQATDNEGNKTIRATVEDAISMDETFSTDFLYTQHYIENELIPNFVRLRNLLLEYSTNVEGEQAKQEESRYVTNLMPDDPRYGEEGTYKWIRPANEELSADDKVEYYNMQIANWKYQLRLNEEAKVTAIGSRDRYLDRNYSFDAGSTVTSTMVCDTAITVTRTSNESKTFSYGSNSGKSFCGVGLLTRSQKSISIATKDTEQNGESNTTSLKYTLKEDGNDDYISVDVFKAPDGFGPIFVTRAGATSAPYEDEVVTKYCDKQTIISHKTMQIEKPEIAVEQAVVSGVPGGEAAKFIVKLRNNSETKESCYFGFRIEAGSNPNGAVVKVDGQNLGSSPQLLIPYGETIKTFTLEQSNTAVLNYEDIAITMFSPNQPDDTGVFPGIYSTINISAYFQPVCSPVDMASSTVLVNSDTKAPVLFSISGYDYSMSSLLGVRLQYKGIHDNDFVTIKEFVKDPGRVNEAQGILPLPALVGSNKLPFSLDLRSNDYTDQTYVFRALAVCLEGTTEITRSSDEITIIRDLSLPQLLSTPTPQSGVLYPGDDISITFNEPIRNDLLAKLNNFKVVGVKNEGEVAHSVGLKVNDKTAATTEAAFNLDGRSFAMGMWLKYSADGTLLQHGTKDNGMTLGINDGKLTVGINGKTVTSEASLPKDKWLYLMLSLDQDRDDARLDARFAQDASTTELLKSYIGEYHGNGNLAIGGNALTGAMQEMTLWNKALPLDELQGSMHQVKNNCTDGLAGYWRFDEGHGSVAADIVRNRHITLNSESAWWKNFTNYALTSGGKLDVSALGFNDNDDFVMETWMNADQQQSEGDVYVLANKPSKLALRMDGDRRLQFDYSGKTAQVTDEAVNDNQWHHVAVAVNHSSNGYAKIYIDGKLRTQVSAQEVYAPRGEVLYLGSYEDGETTSRMQGCIDEVRIWKGQRSATVINDWMYKRANGGEDMLALHLPFETITINEYNQAVTVPSYTNTIDNKVLTPTGPETLAATADNVPALNEAETLENINYSFVANENQVTFRIEEQPAAVEGRIVTFTARNIQDLNGNSNSPVTWSVLVKQSNLTWNEETIDEVQPYGNTSVFTADISNTGIITENWVLSGVPSWLDVSSESGSLPAMKNVTLKFTPQAGMAIGKYDATIMLTGSQGIQQPLYVSLYVKGQAPDWTATPDESNMNVIGQLKVDGVISSDTDDMLAAFRAGKCVGVAHPKYLPKYDAYLVMMDVYGNEEELDNALEYKMYDASTGTVYPLVGASDNRAFTYEADTWIGSFESPVTFTPENKIEQTIACGYEGWKWFSLFAKPESMELASVFAHSNEAIAVIKDEKNSAYCENGLWSGSLKNLSLNGMYKLKTKSAFSEAYLGTPAEDENTVITLSNGWTWLGYPVSIANSLDNALAGADPQEGDMIKGQSGFAIFTDNQWIGSLGMVTPGMGYQYYSNAATKSFTFPKVNASTSARSAVIADETLQLDCESNMTMIAVVKNGDFAVDNATVSVYADGRLCGRSSAPVIGDKHFITIGGNSKSMLTFVVETPSATTQLSQMLTFCTDARLGSIDEPYELQLNDITVINRIESDLSDVTLLEVIDNAGRVVRKTSNPTALPALDKSEYHSADIYNIRLTYRSGETKVFRLTM